MPWSEIFIEAEGLVKIYEGGVKALDGLTFSSTAGIVGLIGPNGAGKTTFVRIAATLLKPTGGSLRVLGVDVVGEPSKVKKFISLVPQDVSPDARSTVYDHVLYYLVARGYSLSDARRRAREILELFDLWSLRNTPCVKLSGGQRKLVIVAAALAPYEAEAVFLDEPTSGLDPANRAKLWGLIARMSREGRRFLVTSHEMEEVEERVEEVVIINRGRFVVQGEPGKLLEGFKDLVCLEILDPAGLRRVLGTEQLLGDAVEKVVELETVAYAYVRRSLYSAVADVLASRGVDFRVRRCSLRDVFLWWSG